MTEHLARYRFILFLFFLLCVLPQSILPQTYPDKSVNLFIKNGIDLIIKQEYDQAEKVFLQLEKTHKEIPLGKIYLAAVLIARSYDYQTEYDHDRITSNLEDAKKISEGLLKKDPGNIWNKYFYALSEGYSAYYDALRERWLSAFSTGVNSVSAFEDCLFSEPDFYEAMIALGSYKFWKSKKTEFLSWLPFIDDEKEIGISYLQSAVKHSGYNSHLAVYSLIWIYIEQDQFSKAILLAENALKNYPESRMFKWGLARALEDSNPEKSISVYYDILNSYPVFLKTNKINFVTLKHIIAQQLVKLKRYDEALEICNEILNLKGFTDFEYGKLEDRIERVKDLKKSLDSK
ncbi:MAG: tetratricopeptide repeat protein [Ignavibacterium sp.]|nr:tetratricopeptide repeat protein [Ignavibacterium sp.]